MTELIHIGIDTSNYTTSLAAVDAASTIVFELRRPLAVRQGERGLRQSDALFQHLRNLPDLLEQMFFYLRESGMASVSASSRPRSVEGSYMPVFNVGVEFGRVVASALKIPYYSFSHQEGHLEAVRKKSELEDEDQFLALQLSGGTCELLEIERTDGRYSIRRTGGSLDISFGQLIDRIGVRLGFAFPAGAEMDKLALTADAAALPAGPRIKVSGSCFNLSGLENHYARLIDEGADRAGIAGSLFRVIGDVIGDSIDCAAAESGLRSVLLAGGVASSRTIRARIRSRFDGTPIRIVFGDAALSSDNAVGIAWLGADAFAATKEAR